jgi:hypothetical protein
MNRKIVRAALIFFTFSFAILNCPGSLAVVVSSDQDKEPEKPVIIYFVDGKETEAKEVDKLDPDTIEKMEFVQDKEKIKQYTDKEVDTVVLITMKKETGEIESEEE